ncbi:unnamed protein product [Psylliodes chrysocephalus]|uniref:C2H2-type domain-containing protein n=1 Tax=Psylliodes chrysocephalus TaxID=3402493 RepID=A0A9P0CM58_9CUCU|nr:unnamed protein product [Psylliodes chrysocephala]
MTETNLPKILTYTLLPTHDRYISSYCSHFFTVLGPVQCHKCSRIYKHKITLNRHLKYECGKNPQFSCHFCSKAYKRKDGLEHHLITTHHTGNDLTWKSGDLFFWR